VFVQKDFPALGNWEGLTWAEGGRGRLVIRRRLTKTEAPFDTKGKSGGIANRKNETKALGNEVLENAMRGPSIRGKSGAPKWWVGVGDKDASPEEKFQENVNRGEGTV